VTKSWKPTAWLLAGLALGGCEALDATAGVEPPPPEGRPYPNLATVPRPPEVAPLAARQQEVDRLMASRDDTLRGDQELRAIDPGRALPPLRPRAAAPAAPRPASPTGEAPSQQPGEPAPQALPPPAAPQAAVSMPRPQLPSSLFMGTVVVASQRGPLAEFQRKVLEDSAAMAKRTNGRIRLVGGQSAEDRQRVAEELVRLGMPADRVVSAADRDGAARPAIDVLVEN
jgi:hypothetical protein